MKEKINKTYITILALMYNYISNKSDFLKIGQIDNFINLINFELYMERKNNLISYDDELQNIYYCDNFNKTVYLNDPDYFFTDAFDYISTIPKDIILTSLKDNILCALNVDKDKIKIVTSYKRVNSFIDVFALSKSDALMKAKECLENYGYKNIEFNVAYPEQNHGDKSYHIIVSYDIETISFDTDSNDKKLLKNSKQNQV